MTKEQIEKEKKEAYKKGYLDGSIYMQDMYEEAIKNGNVIKKIITNQ